MTCAGQVLIYGVKWMPATTSQLNQVLSNQVIKPITLTLLTDSQTTIDSLRSVRPILDRMNQHLLDNVKKCVDQEGLRILFVKTGNNLADKKN